LRQVVQTVPPVNSHPERPPRPRPQPTNPPSQPFGTGGGGQAQWSIQRSTPDHQYSGHDADAALGEWGTASISQQGLVSYKANSQTNRSLKARRW